MSKATLTQRLELRRILDQNQKGYLAYFHGTIATAKKLLALGWVRYVTSGRAAGWKERDAGYELTDSGRAALSQSEAKLLR